MEKENIEIKAKYEDHEFARSKLKEKEAKKIGIDHQTDTYFRVKEGKLKVRKGDIENYLVFYRREEKSGPKTSEILLYETDQPEELNEVLKAALEVLAVVKKKREIYWLENIKIHLDKVKGLGKFIEIELDKTKEGSYSDKADVLNLMEEFKIEEDDLMKRSYSDLIRAD